MVNEVESTRVGLLGGSFSSTYNFGEANKNRLPGLSIANGGIIQVNGNYPTGTGSGAAPIENSEFTVYKRGCTNLVTISSGGNLIIGDDNAPDNNKGILIFENGSELKIESGGILRIHNGSKLVIEAGATLIFHPGALIYLEGAKAVLEFKGNLRIIDGAEFTFTKGSNSVGGFIRFDMSHPSSGIIAEGNTAKFILNGSTTSLYSDKVLEIVGGTLLTPDISQSGSNYLNEFSIYTGTITIGASSKLEVTVPSNFISCIFWGLSSSNSIGLYLPHPELATIERCSFRDLGGGLHMDLYGISPSLEIGLCSFKDNEVGLFTQGGGLNIYNCTFTGNTYGWMAYEFSESNVYQSTFIGNEYGMYVEGNAMPHLYLEESSFLSNEHGLWVNSVELTSQCCRYFYNSDKGIYALYSSLVNLSSLKTINSKTGGNNAFYNNGVAVFIEGELYLEEGQNIFRNNGSYSSNTFLTGYLPACNPCDFMNTSWHLYAAENFWDPGYQSSLEVQTFPHSAPASFTGTPNSTFTSDCFYEGSGGTPIFNFAIEGPEFKKDPAADEDKEDNIELHKELTLYPNPAGNIVFVKGEILSAELFDISGKKMGVFKSSGQDDLWEMDLSGLAPGIYTVAIQQAAQFRFQKIVISR